MVLRPPERRAARGDSPARAGAPGPERCEKDDSTGRGAGARARGARAEGAGDTKSGAEDRAAPRRAAGATRGAGRKRPGEGAGRGWRARERGGAEASGPSEMSGPPRRAGGGAAPSTSPCARSRGRRGRGAAAGVGRGRARPRSLKRRKKVQSARRLRSAPGWNRVGRPAARPRAREWPRTRGPRKGGPGPYSFDPLSCSRPGSGLLRTRGAIGPPAPPWLAETHGRGIKDSVPPYSQAASSAFVSVRPPSCTGPLSIPFPAAPGSIFFSRPARRGRPGGGGAQSPGRP